MKILVFTGNRAEFGLLFHLMKAIESDPETELALLVSGAHLSSQFGNTVEDIKAHNFTISEMVDMEMTDNSQLGILNSMGLAIPKLAKALVRQSPDLVVVLGDRYEALCLAQACLILNVPLAHLHGGEVTEGAYDDAIRHAITKMSDIHFTSSDEHMNRVIQLGENPNRVFNVGAVGLENIQKTPLQTIEELSESIDFKLSKPFFLFCYHPVTNGDEPTSESAKAILCALDKFKDFQVILTYPNSDNGSEEIIKILEKYERKNSEKVKLIKSLGQLRFVNALRHATLIIGNSSSGIIEAPYVKTPTVDIGIRQKGRASAKSVLHSQLTESEIINNIEKSITLKSQSDSQDYSSPYGNGENIAEMILGIIKKIPLNTNKRFFDFTEVEDAVNHS